MTRHPVSGAEQQLFVAVQEPQKTNKMPSFARCLPPQRCHRGTY